MNVLLKGVGGSSCLLLTEQTSSTCTIATLWTYLQEILCNAPDNLQLQQLLVKPSSVSSDRLQHALGAQMLKQQLIFVNSW